MKNYFKALTITTIALFMLIFIIYLAIGFTNNNYDAHTWSFDARAGFSFLAVSAIICNFFIALIVKCEIESYK